MRVASNDPQIDATLYTPIPHSVSQRLVVNFLIRTKSWPPSLAGWVHPITSIQSVLLTFIAGVLHIFHPFRVPVELPCWLSVLPIDTGAPVVAVTPDVLRHQLTAATASHVFPLAWAQAFPHRHFVSSGYRYNTTSAVAGSGFTQAYHISGGRRRNSCFACAG